MVPGPLWAEGAGAADAGGEGLCALVCDAEVDVLSAEEDWEASSGSMAREEAAANGIAVAAQRMLTRKIVARVIPNSARWFLETA